MRSDAVISHTASWWGGPVQVPQLLLQLQQDSEVDGVTWQARWRQKYNETS